MSSIKEILSKYDKNDQKSKQEVLEKLLEIGEKDLNQFVDYIYREEEEDNLPLLIKTLSKIGSSAVESLIEMLEIDEFRFHVMSAISDIRPIPTEKILPLLNDENIKVRKASLNIISFILQPFSDVKIFGQELGSGKYDDSHIDSIIKDAQRRADEVGLDTYNLFIDKLLYFLENEEEDELKGHFAFVFERLAEEKFIEPLKLLIRTGKGTEYLLSQSALALAGYKDNSEVLEFLLQMLKEGSNEIRGYIASALAELSNPKTISHLNDALKVTSSKKARHEMHKALDKMMWKVEYARSSRSKCKKCKDRIPNQELRVGEPYFYSGSLGYYWYHIDCAQLQNLEKQLLLGLEEINSIDKERILSKCKK